MSITTTGNHEVDNATAEIATVLRDAQPGQRDQFYYDEAIRLRDAIMSGTRDLDAAPARRKFKTPEWLRERANDPFGTPGVHPFWRTTGYTTRGVWKLFLRDGWAHAYDTQHNAWAHFPDMAEALDYCARPATDIWA